MNQTIRRIKELDQDLKTLDKLIADGNAAAAGIHVEVSVGAGNEESPEATLDIGIQGDVMGVLNCLRTATANTLAWYERQVVTEFDELSIFLGNRQKDKKP